MQRVIISNCHALYRNAPNIVGVLRWTFEKEKKYFEPTNDLVILPEYIY